MPTCAIPKGLSLQPSPCGVGVRAIPKELSPGSILCRIRSDVIGTKRPASRDRFEGAVRQTHHMQEIERLLRQITNLSAHEVRTNLLFTMSKQNKRQTRRPPQTFLRMTFLTISSTPFFQEEVVEPDGIEPTTSCLQSRRSPS